MKSTTHFTLLIISILVLGCNKKESPPEPKGTVDLYLLKSYETKEFRCQIDDSTVITKSEPFIHYNEFLSYDPDKCLFKITDEVTNRLDTMHFPVSGTAFAIKANNELIYSGYFWPAYSSMACNWITIDPVFISYRGGLEVELGYPGTFEGQEIPDKRNDQRILDIFERDHKLE